MATKKTKHDEPEPEVEVQEPESTPEPEPAPEPEPVKLSGEELKAKLREERRAARLNEKGY